MYCFPDQPNRNILLLPLHLRALNAVGTDLLETRQLQQSSSSSYSTISWTRTPVHGMGTSPCTIPYLPGVIWVSNRVERQNSRSSAHSTRRVSPWDGPLARDNGITYRTGPVKPSPGRGDEEYSSEEEWENAPVIPVHAFVRNGFNASSISTSASSEASTPHQVPIRLQHTPPPPAPPVIPGAPAQYALGMMTPVVAPGALPYGYPQRYLRSVYSTPYQSPVMPSGVPILRPLSRASYMGMGYQSPYIP